MNNIDYSKSYKEVLEILKYIPKEDIDRIPIKQIEFFERNADINYDFEYDSSKTLNEQNVSNIAKCIIIFLFKEYWANETQKLKILKKEKADKELMEIQKKELYNPDNIFKSRTNAGEYNLQNESKELIEYKKQKWYEKIFEKFFKIFKNR